MMEIADRDIERVERLFFPDGGDFKDEENERYDFIKCIDRSVDVHACPGSGKTTSLLAKLYLLSEKMTFDDGRAICVLTHTNVAIDTIKNRLGPKADNLFKYPNFFGTIQSFVNKYLAIPAFIKLYNKRPLFIDNDFYGARLRSLYNSYDYKTRGWFYHQGRGSGISGLDYFRNVVRVQIDQDNSISYIKNLEWDQPLLKSKKTRSYKLLKETKGKIFQEGILCFDDSYSLSKWYISIHKNLKYAFSNRFAYVFIDEMQDTYLHQYELIEEVFNDSVIVQRIGDLNQSILGEYNGKQIWEKNEDHIKITGSRRFSNEISEVLKCVAIEPEEDLVGFFDSGIAPQIITYDEDSIEEVIEKFIGLVSNYELDDKSEYSGNPIKAIGWRGTESDALTIGNYFPDFKKNITTKRSGYPNFISLIAYNLDVSPKQFKDSILVGLIEAIYLDGITITENEKETKVTKTKFLKSLNGSEDQFFHKISEIYKNRKIEDLTNLHDEIITFLFDDLFPKIGLELQNDGLNYLRDNEIEEISITESKSSNIYKSDNPDFNSISVEVSTVHNVKGETHTATLYLETEFNRKTCGQYLMEQLLGVPYEGYGQTGNSYRDMCMKVAHVGFSRPTDLLCVAINRDLVSNHEDELKEFGWEII